MTKPLAKNWYATTKLWGKIEHLLSLEENDDDVVIVITEVPFWGIKWLISPAEEQFSNGEILLEDFIRDANVEYYFDEALKGGTDLTDTVNKRSRVQKSTLDKVKTGAVSAYNRYYENHKTERI